MRKVNQLWGISYQRPEVSAEQGVRDILRCDEQYPRTYHRDGTPSDYHRDKASQTTTIPVTSRLPRPGRKGDKGDARGRSHRTFF